MSDQRISEYRKAALSMKEGLFDVRITAEGTDEVAQLGTALQQLAHTLESRFQELRTLANITERINAGLLLDDILNYVYETFRPVIPYDRIGFSLLDDDGTLVRAHWARSDAPHMEITQGYSAKLEGSSLQQIIETKQPRILNDLEQYLRDHPNSDSTRRIVQEGMRSSLTCPLIALGKPTGFMFFSSMKPFTYQRIHTELFVQVAGQLSMIVEKGRLYQQLVELNELKNKFLGMAAHDLRNPISAIKGLSEVMLEVSNQGLTPDGLDILKMIHDASEMMLLLVNDLLDVNAIESGRVVIHLQLRDIREILQACLRANRIAARQKSIELTVEVDESVPTLSIDGARIEHVVNILISNAIKYSRPETSIALRARTVGEEVHVSVVDQGQGIPANELKNLFRDFSRISVRPTAGEKSTGLGLAIARRVVEAHQGRIWVESSVGVGSTFTFSIPIVHQG